MSVENQGYEPKIIVFACNWCTYAAADLARLNNPKTRMEKVKCSGKLDPLLLLQIFENGADGVMVAGCNGKNCPYGSDFEYNQEKHQAFTGYLQGLGFDKGRFQAFWPKEMEGPHFYESFSQLYQEIIRLGPYNKQAGKDTF